MIKNLGYKVFAVWSGDMFMVEVCLGEYTNLAKAYNHVFNHNLYLEYSKFDKKLDLFDKNSRIKEVKDKDIIVKHLPEYKENYPNIFAQDFEPVMVNIDGFDEYEELSNIHDMNRMGEKFDKIIRLKCA